MDQDGRLREDVISPLLKVSTFKGYTLTGPKEAIVRKVYSNQVVSTTTAVGAAHDGANQNQQGSFTLRDQPNSHVECACPPGGPSAFLCATQW